jgi:hypothetical protein
MNQEPSRMNIKSDLRMLVNNKGFVLTTLSSTILVSYFLTLSSVLTDIVYVYGFNINEASYLGTMFLVAGIIGGIVTSIIVTKT